MTDLFMLLGPWFWWIVAGVLLVGELLAPGVFLLWLAMAAALTGVADFALGLGWRSEVAVFAALSLLLVLASWKWVMAQRKPNTDQPHLNLRHGAYVGRVFPLDSAIVQGTGKVKIEDALWDVDGPDMPAGTRVRITGVNGLRLVGERAD